MNHAMFSCKGQMQRLISKPGSWQKYILDDKMEARVVYYMDVTQMVFSKIILQLKYCFSIW